MTFESNLQRFIDIDKKIINYNEICLKFAKCHFGKIQSV
jgi:hypothetical protein